MFSKNPADVDPRMTTFVLLFGGAVLLIFRYDFRPAAWRWGWVVLGVFGVLRYWAWRLHRRAMRLAERSERAGRPEGPPEG